MLHSHPQGVPEAIFQIRLTTQSISSYVGTKSSTWNGLIDTGMFSPWGGTWKYRPTCSAVIRLKVNPIERRRVVKCSLIPPLYPVTGLLLEGCSTPSSCSFSFPSSSVHLCLSPLRFVLIARPRHQIRAWYIAGLRRAEILLSTILHVSADTPRLQMESDNIWPEMLDGLHHISHLWPVEH